MTYRPKTVAQGWVPRTHGIPSSYTRGCRCADCTAANTARARVNGANLRLQRRKYDERVTRNGQLVHPDPYGGHGTIAAYTSCGCRCSACQAVMAVYRRNLTETRAAERVEIDGRMVHPSPPGGHGKATTYNAWSCRCEPCTAANRERYHHRVKRRATTAESAD